MMDLSNRCMHDTYLTPMSFCLCEEVHHYDTAFYKAWSFWEDDSLIYRLGLGFITVAYIYPAIDLIDGIQNSRLMKKNWY